MLMAGRMHPPFLFCRAKRETGRARSKEKSVGALRYSGPPRDGDRRIGASADLGWPSGTLSSSASLQLPSRGGWCGERRGARTHLSCFSLRAFRFATRSPGARRGRCPHRPVAEVPSTTGQRQRKEKLDVSQTSPGQRSPQGQRVSVPDCRAGQPTIPRRRQEVCACADRPAEALFLFHRARRILFLAQPKREWGAHPAWTMPLGGSQTPMAAVGKSCLTSKTPAPRRPCRASRRSDRTAGPCRAKPPAAGGWPRR